MISKRQILPILLLLLFSGGVQAQHTAQATMRVSVEIVSGVSATTTATKVNFTGDGFRGEVGTVSLSGAKSGEVVIKNDSKITLKNKEGHLVEVPVDMKQGSNPGHPTLNYSANGSSSNRTYKGNYSGTLSTTIEYL